ncbi:hypothetical protein KA107_01300 [Candidatus Pacearchaeota archaeon]|nr:hypothetical protein [Candidatus Pacearchaeota archaeon]
MVKNDWDEGFAEWKSKKKARQVAKDKSLVGKIEKEVVQEVKEVESFMHKEERLHPVLFHFLHILAWAIPIAIILFVFYVNYLPFGYHAEYTIQVMDDGSVKSNSPYVYFEDLKGKRIKNLSDIYSLGAFNLVVKPKVVLKGANVSVSINGTDVYLAELNFSVENNTWDYFWDFTTGIPSPLNGTANYDSEKGCVYFNGSNNETLYYPNSSDMFENDSFIVYVKWKPEDMNGSNQQIIGHYNWELWQSANFVRFMVGRLGDINGSMPSISYNANESFFNQTHSAIAIYSSDENNSKGYIELWIDDLFVGRKNILNQTIWEDYNEDKNLGDGWSPHNYRNNSYFTGCLYETGFRFKGANYLLFDNFKAKTNKEVISLIGNGDISYIGVEVNK